MGRKAKIYTYKGFPGSLPEVCNHFGVNLTTIFVRMKKGMSLQEAIEAPIIEYKKVYIYKDFTGTLKEICNHFGVHYDAIYQRMRKGLSFEEAMKAPLMQNRIYTYKGISGTRPEICKHFGIRYLTVCKRIERTGESFEKALDVQKRKICKNAKIYTYKEFSGSLSEICKIFNVKYPTVYMRVRNGMSLEEAMNPEELLSKHKDVKIYTCQGFSGSRPEICKHFGINYQTICKRIERTGKSFEEVIATPVRKRSLDIEKKIYTHQDFSGTLPEVCKHFNVSYRAILNRLQVGISLEKAIETPIKARNKIYTYKEFSGNLKDICNYFKMEYNTITDRMRRGMSLEDAMDQGKTSRKSRKDIKIYTYKEFSGSLPEICKHLNINIKLCTVYRRMEKGMSLEEAIETPVRKRS